MFAAGGTTVPYILQEREIDEVSLCRSLLGVVPPAKIRSPLREGDKNPSFSVTMYNGHVYCKDWGTGWTGTIVKLAMDMQGKTRAELAGTFKVDAATSIRVEDYMKPKPFLAVKTRPWKASDLEYWKRFGINSEWLDFAEVYPISRIYSGEHAFPAEPLAFAYAEHKDNIDTLKVYQPFGKIKWLSSHDSSVWDLWKQLPPIGDKLILTSSRKDALCLWSNVGIPSVCLQGEGYIPKPHVMQQILDRFLDVYVLYDNDFSSSINHGHEFGHRIANMFAIKQIEIPAEYQSKDPSDLMKNHGRKVFNNVITNLLNI